MGNCFLKSQKTDDQEIVSDKYKDNSQSSSDKNNKPVKTPQNQNSPNIIQIKEVSNQEHKNSDECKVDIQVNSQSIDNQEDAIKKRQVQKKHQKIRGQTHDAEEQVLENITKLDRKLSEKDVGQLIKCLGNHFVFQQLSDNEKNQILQKMFYCENKIDYVFKQGDQASCYFIIDQGECEIIINDKLIRTLPPGQGFGELALLYGAPRSASVKCKSQSCGFWAIDRVTFRKAVEEIVNREFEENRKFIDNTKFFNIMTEMQKNAIAHVTITQVFKKNEVIVHQGDIASSYYIIKSGKCMVVKNGQELRKLEENEEFGEQALLQNSVRGASVVAYDETVKLLAIGRDQIQKVLGDKVQVIIYQNLQKWALDQNDMLKKLTRIQVEKIVANTTINNYKKGDIIFPLNQVPNKLAFQNSNTVICKKGYVWGDKWLLEKYKERQLEYNVKIDDDGVLAELPFSKFYELVGGKNLDQVITKAQNSHEVKYMKKSEADEAGKWAYLKLEDMINIKKLGFGQFGSVYLVKNSIDKKHYALKVIQKAQVVEQSLEKHLLQEKKVLEMVKFPFIMYFIRSMKDNNNIYFLNEYIRGMELFDVIREIGLLGTFDSQFFVGSLLLCVEYLHTNNVIYRDIKPENVMVDEKGYIKLIDMGTAKFLKGKSGRTFTIIGTPHYMAPEIITGKGYTYNVDLWSIGICLYEFMAGGVPFAEDAEDPYEIYEEIIRKPLAFPNYLKDSLAKKLMHQLLNRTSEMRLGGSFAALKANQWFEKFDWDQLMDRAMKAPYIPPRDKLISPSDMVKQEQLNKLVIDEIKSEQKNIKASKLKPKDPNWDKEF